VAAELETENVPDEVVSGTVTAVRVVGVEDVELEPPPHADVISDIARSNNVCA
jgi:hypothetical protein